MRIAPADILHCSGCQLVSFTLAFLSLPGLICSSSSSSLSGESDGQISLENSTLHIPANFIIVCSSSGRKGEEQRKVRGSQAWSSSMYALIGPLEKITASATTKILQSPDIIEMKWSYKSSSLGNMWPGQMNLSDNSIPWAYINWLVPNPVYVAGWNLVDTHLVSLGAFASGELCFGCLRTDTCEYREAEEEEDSARVRREAEGLTSHVGRTVGSVRVA